MFPNNVDLDKLDLTDYIYDTHNSTYESKIIYNNADFVLCVDKMCLLGVSKATNDNIVESSFIKSNNMFYTFVYNLSKYV